MLSSAAASAMSAAAEAVPAAAVPAAPVTAETVPTEAVEPTTMAEAVASKPAAPCESPVVEPMPEAMVIPAEPVSAVAIRAVVRSVIAPISRVARTVATG